MKREDMHRHDNKLLLQCPNCHATALVDVKPVGETTYVCPYCEKIIKVTSEKRTKGIIVP